MTNELFELAAKRRSIRRYTNDHISDDILNEIMRVALTAPSSFGHRSVEFVVVQDQDRIRELASCKSYGGSQIIGAGAVVVVMVNLDRGEFWIEDGSIASSYILLAAEQYNVGACWVHIRNRDGKRKPEPGIITRKTERRKQAGSKIKGNGTTWEQTER